MLSLFAIALVRYLAIDSRSRRLLLLLLLLLVLLQLLVSLNKLQCTHLEIRPQIISNVEELGIEVLAEGSSLVLALFLLDVLQLCTFLSRMFSLLSLSEK